MARPGSFKYSFIAMQNIPYTEGDGTHPASCGGVLGQGGVVWTDHPQPRMPARITAFLEAVGVVCLDPRWLVPPERYRGALR